MAGSPGKAEEFPSYVGGGALSDPGRWLSLVPEPVIDQGPAKKKASLQRKAKKIKRDLKKAKRQKDRRKIRPLSRQLKQTNRAIRRIQVPPGLKTLNIPGTPPV